MDVAVGAGVCAASEIALAAADSSAISVGGGDAPPLSKHALPSAASAAMTVNSAVLSK